MSKTAASVLDAITDKSAQEIGKEKDGKYDCNKTDKPPEGYEEVENKGAALLLQTTKNSCAELDGNL